MCAPSSREETSSLFPLISTEDDDIKASQLCLISSASILSALWIFFVLRKYVLLLSATFFWHPSQAQWIPSLSSTLERIHLHSTSGFFLLMNLEWGTRAVLWLSCIKRYYCLEIDFFASSTLLLLCPRPFEALNSRWMVKLRFNSAATL